MHAGTSDGITFTYCCGADLQYSYFLQRSYNQNGELVYDQETLSWGFIYGSGSTCSSEFSDELVLTSVPIYYQPVYYEYPTDEIRFAPNFSLPNNALSLPLQENCSGIACTPYTVAISAMMDQTTLGQGAVYVAGENGAVSSFEGELGNVGPYSGSTCYRKPDNSAFGASINYIGTSGTGGENYLCYDAHPGYDYPQPCYTTNIYAPAAGTLCVASANTSQQNPVDVWRDTSRCPLATAGSTSWPGYHTFYIIHDDLRINGSTNDYMTVFLHSDDLESSVKTAIEQNGYVQVAKNQHIAQVGDTGSEGACHLHFEVYKYNTSTSQWDRVDPYGDGTNNILWEH